VTGSETGRPYAEQVVLRTGRKVGRTIYRQVGREPSDDDILIGIMDTPAYAATVVHAVNNCATDRNG
jgi:hypothetical protein